MHLTDLSTALATERRQRLLNEGAEHRRAAPARRQPRVSGVRRRRSAAPALSARLLGSARLTS
jgi:hypothetical protein